MAKKKILGGEVVLIEGQQYTVPEGYDPAEFKKQMELEKGIFSGLKETETAARGAVTELEKGRGANVTELRRKGAQALASQRGLVTGGRGLGLARSTGKDIATREATLRTRAGKEISEARKVAAATGVASKVEESKLLEASAARKQSASVAEAEVEGIIVDEQGSLWTNQDDRNRMVKRLKEKLSQATNPYEAEVYQKAINKIISSGDTKGSIDL